MRISYVSCFLNGLTSDGLTAFCDGRIPRSIKLLATNYAVPTLTPMERSEIIAAEAKRKLRKNPWRLSKLISKYSEFSELAFPGLWAAVAF